MSKHERNNCPRCGKEFECRVNSVLKCQCASVALSQSQRDYVHSLYDDCLCAQCLKVFQIDLVLYGYPQKVSNL